METPDIFNALEEKAKLTAADQEGEEINRIQESLKAQLRALEVTKKLTPFTSAMWLGMSLSFSPLTLVKGIVETAADAENLKYEEFLDTLPKDIANQWHWLRNFSLSWMLATSLAIGVVVIIWAYIKIFKSPSPETQASRKERDAETDERLVGLTITQLREEYENVTRKAKKAEFKGKVLLGVLPWFTWFVFLLALPSLMKLFGFEARKLFGPAKSQ